MERERRESTRVSGVHLLPLSSTPTLTGMKRLPETGVTEPTVTVDSGDPACARLPRGHFKRRLLAVRKWILIPKGESARIIQ